MRERGSYPLGAAYDISWIACEGITRDRQLCNVWTYELLYLMPVVCMAGEDRNSGDVLLSFWRFAAAEVCVFDTLADREWWEIGLSGEILREGRPWNLDLASPDVMTPSIWSSRRRIDRFKDCTPRL